MKRWYCESFEVQLKYTFNIIRELELRSIEKINVKNGEDSKRIDNEVTASDFSDFQ